MNIVERLREQLAASQAQVKILHEDNQIKDRQLQMFASQYEHMTQKGYSPARRNLSAEISKMEVQRLNKKIEHMEADISLKIRRSTFILEMELEKEKKKSLELEEKVQEYYDILSRPQIEASDDDYINFLSVELRAAQEELQEKTKALLEQNEESTKLWLGNLKASQERVREKTRWEEEKSELKKEIEKLKKENETIQRMFVNEERYVNALNRSIDKIQEIREEHKIQRSEDQQKINDLEEQFKKELRLEGTVKKRVTFKTFSS